MAKRREIEATDWQSVIARALSYLCLHVAEVKEASMTTKARFLSRLGLPRPEAAKLLGTSAESLRVLASRKKKTKGKKRGTKKTASTRGR